MKERYPGIEPTVMNQCWPLTKFPDNAIARTWKTLYDFAKEKNTTLTHTFVEKFLATHKGIADDGYRIDRVTYPFNAIRPVSSVLKVMMNDQEEERKRLNSNSRKHLHLKQPICYVWQLIFLICGKKTK